MHFNFSDSVVADMKIIMLNLQIPKIFIAVKGKNLILNIVFL